MQNFIPSQRGSPPRRFGLAMDRKFILSGKDVEKNRNFNLQSEFWGVTSNLKQ